MAEIKIEVKGYKCERCSHEWIPRKKDYPTLCPNCKSAYWDKQKKKKELIFLSQITPVNVTMHCVSTLTLEGADFNKKFIFFFSYQNSLKELIVYSNMDYRI